MSTTTLIHAEAVSIIREGWKLLVEQLGLQKATRFVMLLERGKGDTVQEIEAYWSNMSIEEIHKQVVTWKRETEKKQLNH
ncbi:MAG: hypothetical protein HUU32_09905 [Calditrichaceae bacterium]|nr:hypothetical protein [Calditrichia bacterium]NUQ41694.1 hypothetical protein [Calditrichaceae bacterium]